MSSRESTSSSLRGFHSLALWPFFPLSFSLPPPSFFLSYSLPFLAQPCQVCGRAPRLHRGWPPTVIGLYSLSDSTVCPFQFFHLDSSSRNLSASKYHRNPDAARIVVNTLNRYIVGQEDAKRAVAVALRNRWRRKQLHESVRGEVTPKNILMVRTSSHCGNILVSKPCIFLFSDPFGASPSLHRSIPHAPRSHAFPMASLISTLFAGWSYRLREDGNCSPPRLISWIPLHKVEATKFTEVGFHGRDVDMIVRDPVESSITCEEEEDGGAPASN